MKFLDQPGILGLVRPFKGFESEYELKENFYVKSVAEADLNFHIDDVNDSKFFNDGLCKAP